MKVINYCQISYGMPWAQRDKPPSEHRPGPAPCSGRGSENRDFPGEGHSEGKAGSAQPLRTDVQILTYVYFCTDIFICGSPMLTAMTFDFHRNRYRSRRGPSDAAVTVRMPRSLSYDLTSLSLAYEEPKCSILLRIIEQYVDSHRDDVELGEWRLAHYSPGGWGGDDSETRLTLSEDTPDEGGTENRDAGHPPTE